MDKILGPFARRWQWAKTVLDVHDRFSQVHGGHLAASITLAAFLSIFPLVLLLIAVLGRISAGVEDLPGRIATQLGLTGDAERIVTDAVGTARRSRRAASAVGLVGLLWSGLGLVAALAAAFDAVWQVTGRGLKAKLYGLAWLAGAGSLLLASFSLTGVLNVLPAAFAPLNIVGGLALGLVLWIWTFKVLTTATCPGERTSPGRRWGRSDWRC